MDQHGEFPEEQHYWPSSGPPDAVDAVMELVQELIPVPQKAVMRAKANAVRTAVELAIRQDRLFIKNLVDPDAGDDEWLAWIERSRLVERQRGGEQ